jgi:sulfate adenylyltransferase subunit 2
MASLDNLAAAIADLGAEVDKVAADVVKPLDDYMTREAPRIRPVKAESRFDAVFGGARRDEERSRAKERIYSFRDRFHQWDPKNQRPELWSLYNGRIQRSESVRVFPLSNWTELDVWEYIARENMELPSIYFAHERHVVLRDNMWLGVGEWVVPSSDEKIEVRTVRFRTVGDANLTGAVDSDADTIEKIIDEISIANVSERGATRADDRFSETAMEDRKREGYF